MVLNDSIISPLEILHFFTVINDGRSSIVAHWKLFKMMKNYFIIKFLIFIYIATFLSEVSREIKL